MVAGSVAFYRRALARSWQAGEAGALPVHFHARVLRDYLDRPGAKVLRTDNVGRLLLPGRALLDFGIVDDDRVIHVRFDDLVQQLPDSERDHWLQHLVTPSLSSVYLQMQLNPASCHDDGPIREWVPADEA